MKRMLLVVILLLSMVACEPIAPTRRRGGEILRQEGKYTLYRCGLSHEDICLNDGRGITVVYYGE